MRPTEVRDAGRPAPLGLSRSALLASVMTVLLLATSIAPFGPGWEVFYLAFVVATAVMVRTAPVAPGSLLRRRARRRLLVVLIALIAASLALATEVGPAPERITPWCLVALVLLDLALGRATGRVAAAPDSAVDEREEQLRNRVHRQSYYMIGLLLGGGVLVASCASFTTRRWIWDAMHGGLPFAVAQVMFFLPAMTLAWQEPDGTVPDAAAPPVSRRCAAAPPVLGVASLVPLVLSVSIALAPVRVMATSSAAPSSKPGEHCVAVHSRVTVGWAIRAVIPLDGLACAGGTRAYQAYCFHRGDAHPGTADCALATTLRCSRLNRPDGTLSFTDSS